MPAECTFFLTSDTLRLYSERINCFLMANDSVSSQDTWEPPAFTSLSLHTTQGFKGIEVSEASGKDGTIFGGSNGSS